jgi:hypothetical protein
VTGGRGDSGGTRGAMGPPAPSHANSRAGRPPAEASGGGRTGGIGGAPKHNGGGVETLAAEGIGMESRGGAERSKRYDGVDQEAAVRLRLVVAASATGAGGWWRGRHQGRLELASERRGEGWVVGQCDRSVGRTDRVRLRPAGQPGRDGPVGPERLRPA